MKCNAFVKSLKVSTRNFRSEVVRTSNEFSYLELQYKELQKNLVPVFRSFLQEKDSIELAERRNRRENDRIRINSRPKSERKSFQDSDIIQNGSIRPKSELVHTRGINLNEISNDNQNFQANRNTIDRRRVIQAPCHVMTFEKERYTPFNARANSTQIRIKRTFPPPKNLVELAEKKRAARESQEAKMKVKLPRVAYLSTTSPT